MNYILFLPFHGFWVSQILKEWVTQLLRKWAQDLLFAIPVNIWYWVQRGHIKKTLLRQICLTCVRYHLPRKTYLDRPFHNFVASRSVAHAPELRKMIWSPDLEALKLWKGRSGYFHGGTCFSPLFDKKSNSLRGKGSDWRDKDWEFDKRRRKTKEIGNQVVWLTDK